MRNEVWVLGATGRTGRVIVTLLHKRGIPLVLVGRDRARLENLAAELGNAPRILVGTLDSALARLAQDRPGVVVNTVGPFTSTALQVARACPPGTHYVDIANELTASEDILRLDRQAAKADQTFVTGAGFGVLSTESVVLRLCEGQPRPLKVRVDALPSIAIEAGVVGIALASTIVDIAASGGREVRQGRLVTSKVVGNFAQLTTPNGEKLTTGSGPSSELIAAWYASDADYVIAASTIIPSNPVIRFILLAVSRLMRLSPASRLTKSIIARVPLRPQAMSRPNSWGHARVEWSDGTVREGWLRVGDGTDFTAAVTTEVTHRLLKGEGKPGSYTPGSLFGAKLAEAAGGEFVLN